VKSICEIPDCGRPVKTRQWCGTHYSRWLHHGDASWADGHVWIRDWEEAVEKNGPIPSYRTELGPCWIWTRGLAGGYGRWRRRPVHVRSYERYVNLVPDGAVLDHLCRVRSCCNPKHLEPVTNRENLARGFGWSGRNARKTHFVYGHEFTPQSTYIDSRGCRKCRPCAARRATELRERRRIRTAA
jgi:hypothetical protein